MVLVVNRGRLAPGLTCFTPARNALILAARYPAVEVRACERVRSVRGLKVSPETKPLTPRGETAVAAEFEAEMFYCD